MKKEVILLVGAGKIGMAIAWRIFNEQNISEFITGADFLIDGVRWMYVHKYDTLIVAM